jgi:hypothetical protein
MTGLMTGLFIIMGVIILCCTLETCTDKIVKAIKGKK